MSEHSELQELQKKYDALLKVHEADQEELSQLNQSLARFQTAFTLNPTSLTIVDLETKRCVEANQGFEILTGLSQEDIIGKTSSELTFWEDINDRDRFLAEVAEKGSVSLFEAGFISKSGNILKGLVSSEVIMINEKPHLLTVTRDITTLADARKKLENSKTQIQALLNAPNYSIYC